LAINAARIIHLETSVLTGASLDKAGAIYPLKRVGIIQWAKVSGDYATVQGKRQHNI
jgi:hypothetical protein